MKIFIRWFRVSRILSIADLEYDPLNLFIQKIYDYTKTENQKITNRFPVSGQCPLKIYPPPKKKFLNLSRKIIPGSKR